MITDRRHREREEENLLKLSNSILKNIGRNSSPPKHRHDGTSPLPLGMDWSPPPRNWVYFISRVRFLLGNLFVARVVCLFDSTVDFYYLNNYLNH